MTQINITIPSFENPRHEAELPHEAGTASIAVPILVTCNGISVPDPPPSVSIPNYGVMSKAWTTLDRIPNAMEMLAGMQDQLATAMAPVKRYIEIVETLAAFKNCMSAIIDAVSQMNPDPIFDCVKLLLKVIPRILSWMPPMCYVRTGCEIASYCIDLIDEIIRFFSTIDGIITGYIQTLQNARLTGDTELENIVRCAMSGVTSRLPIALDLLVFIKPVNDVLMDMFLRTLPGGEQVKMLRKAMRQYGGAADTILSLSSSSRAAPLISLPDDPFGPIVKPPGMGEAAIAMNICRNACVSIYNILAPLVGMEPTKQTRADPVFVNF